MKKTLSQQVAEIGEKLTFEDLPDYVVENSKKFILDLLGNLLASKHIESSRIVVDVVTVYMWAVDYANGKWNHGTCI